MVLGTTPRSSYVKRRGLIQRQRAALVAGLEVRQQAAIDLVPQDGGGGGGRVQGHLGPGEVHVDPIGPAGPDGRDGRLRPGAGWPADFAGDHGAIGEDRDQLGGVVALAAGNVVVRAALQRLPAVERDRVERRLPVDDRVVAFRLGVDERSARRSLRRGAMFGRVPDSSRPYRLSHVPAGRRTSSAILG